MERTEELFAGSPFIVTGVPVHFDTFRRGAGSRGATWRARLFPPHPSRAVPDSGAFVSPCVTQPARRNANNRPSGPGATADSAFLSGEGSSNARDRLRRVPP